MLRYGGDGAIVFGACQTGRRRGARGIGSLAGRRIKKGPGGCFDAATEADQPGMGMTNRVIPAQGEERGASYSLTGLDGDASRKFQSRQEQFIVCARSAVTAHNQLNIGEFFLKRGVPRQALADPHRGLSYASA